MPGSSPFVCVALKDSSIKLIDFVNEANQAQIETLHEGPGIDREIHLSPIKQTRWQELRTALRLHGQWD